MSWLRNYLATSRLHAFTSGRSPNRYLTVVRWIHAGPSASPYESRYAEKLQQKAKE